MQNSRQKSAENFIKLLEIMEQLRGPQGCPWDKEQTHQSVIPYLVEETYEVIDAIDKNDSKHLQEELGDLLFQIVFHSQLAEEDNKFDISKVLEGIADKLTRRHPHVFGDLQVKNADEVVQNWEQIKATEKKGSLSSSLLSEIPKGLPSLLKAYKIGKKVSQVGFDWPEVAGVLSKVKEEIEELEQGIRNQKQSEIMEEMGDLLFSIANFARYLKVNPEEALRHTNEKFSRRFQHIENKLKKQNKKFSDVSFEEMDLIWNEAKQIEKTNSQIKN